MALSYYRGKPVTTAIPIPIPDDPDEARIQYIKLRQSVREVFQDFLRNLNSQSLRWLEQAFEKNGGDLDSSVFLRIFSKVFPQPSSTDFTGQEERRFIVHL